MENHTINKEGLKLTRNTKGYAWEIRVLSLGEILEDKDFVRLENFNKKMYEKFGLKKKPNTSKKEKEIKKHE